MEETSSAVETVDTPDLTAVITELSEQPLSAESFKHLSQMAFATDQTFEELRGLLRDWSSVEARVAAKETSDILRGFCALIGGDDALAESSLKEHKGHPWAAYHLARSYLTRGQIEHAIDTASAAYSKYSDSNPLACILVELRCAERDFDAAFALLEKIDRSTGDYHVAKAIFEEKSGNYAEAIEEYRKAIEIEPRNGLALFRLAYLVDIHGSDADEANDEAVLAYESCVKSGIVHLNAVINLGLLYEDRERYHDAIKCYETAIRYYPNHERAKLFLGDAQSSTTMFYDREQEKKADRQSQVLKIPVTDFELSVRSRNCLQKMNIRTLGDLIMKSEQELLSYKNFGETSLDEIKSMLGQKGLRLGQGLEDGGREPQHGRNPLEATADPDTLDKPIDDLEFSVRSRRCMERLGVRSVRDLINKTEVELMSAKNFGMTSLNEIKQKLNELGMELRS